MAKKKTPQQPREVAPLEKLGLRASAMINSPKAQADHRVVIHRLDTDPDDAWLGLIDLLRETDGISVEVSEDQSLVVTWGETSDDDRRIEDGALQAADDEAPF